MLDRLSFPLAAVLAFCAVAASQEFTAPPKPNATPAAASISLSPAIIMAQGKFGQTLSQTLTISDHTSQEFAFELVAQDVLVQDGKRVFVAAGETENSIAATAVFSQKTVVVQPYSSANVDVRFTVPNQTNVRAVVAIFKGTNKIPTRNGSVSMLASLGTLITFNLTDQLDLKSETAKVSPATDHSNLSFSQTLTNAGIEPILPDGVVAIIGADGKLVGKSSFPPQRLLPGERLEYAAEYADRLDPGNYKAIYTFQYGGSRTLTSEAAFTVP